MSNIYAEQALLGALILDSSAIDKDLADFKSEYFSNELHARIFDAICVLRDFGSDVTPIGVARRFWRDNEFSVLDIFLEALKNEVFDKVFQRSYSEIILEQYLQYLIEETISLKDVKNYAKILRYEHSKVQKT